jgi:DNA repair protein RadC
MTSQQVRRAAEPPLKWSPDSRWRIRELPDVDRPREKLLSKGAEALSDVELLAVVLGSGTRGTGVLELAATLLSAFDGHLDGVDPLSLQAVSGVGRAKACCLVAAMELARRHGRKGRPAIRTAVDVLPYLEPVRREKQEHFVCLALNGAGEVLASRVVTVGLLDTNQVHPREVFADPIADRAASVIVAHNHPSGTLDASAEDLALTKRLVQAGRLLGIPVLDHLIVTTEGYLSLKTEGKL